MKSDQINNLLTFTLLFHKCIKDSALLNCDITYIYDKYQKLIGFDPKEIDIDKDDFINVELILNIKREWLNKWGKTLTKSQESILNYLCIMNIVSLTPNRIFSLFEKYIGSIDRINKIEYLHIHPLIKNFIFEYKSKFKREINIEILT